MINSSFKPTFATTHLPNMNHSMLIIHIYTQITHVVCLSILHIFYTYIYTYMLTYNVHVHTYIHTYKYIHIRTSDVHYKHTYIHYMHAYIHTYFGRTLQTYIHSLHACLYTYIHFLWDHNQFELHTLRIRIWHRAQTPCSWWQPHSTPRQFEQLPTTWREYLPSPANENFSQSMHQSSCHV
jgi:hypothetical protein